MKRYLDAIHFLTLKYNVDVLSIQQFLTKEDNIYLANKLIDEVEVIMDNNFIHKRSWLEKIGNRLQPGFMQWRNLSSAPNLKKEISNGFCWY